MGVVALLVRWDSPGPALFRQERVGRHGSRFMMFKFRSMRHGSGDQNHRDAAAAWFVGAPSPEGYKSERDPRITAVGRSLRRTTLDELPQIFNVLRGEMSLVGPRPAIPYELEYYQPWYFERLRVKPGMTGLWQVSGRDRLSASEMMALDRRYVQKCSLGLDLHILGATLPAVVANFTKRWKREASPEK
jgi:lipopolysaccharide/colanic/teichoic acid biosynthesis glycosyltransferase